MSWHRPSSTSRGSRVAPLRRSQACMHSWARMEPAITRGSPANTKMAVTYTESKSSGPEQEIPCRKGGLTSKKRDLAVGAARDVDDFGSQVEPGASPTIPDDGLHVRVLHAQGQAPRVEHLCVQETVFVSSSINSQRQYRCLDLAENHENGSEPRMSLKKQGGRA